MKRLLMLMGIVVAAACGGDGKPGVGGGGLTLGDVCDQVGRAVCEKIEDCGPAEPDCEDEFKAACCEDDGECDDEANRGQSAVDDCTDDIQALSCSATTIPSSCTGF